MMRKIYHCDVCQRAKLPQSLTGCHFLSPYEFDLKKEAEGAKSHICYRCLAIIAAQAPEILDGLPAPEEGSS